MLGNLPDDPILKSYKSGEIRHLKGRKKLKVEWDLGENGAFDSAAYKQAMMETPANPGAWHARQATWTRSLPKAARPWKRRIRAMLAHAAMEPLAAVAEFKDGKVVTWTATQNPQAVQETVARAVGIKKEDVTCHVTLLGGGFGRKSKPDYVAEAALLSKQVGKPVKIVWSREDDVQFDYFHSPAALYLKAAVDEKGHPTAWLSAAFSRRLPCRAIPTRSMAASSSAWAGPTCVGFIHCVGSRDEKAGNKYCSKACCITAIKLATRVKEKLPDCEVFCFYMDLQIFGRHFERNYQNAQVNHGIRFIRGRLSECFENPDGSVMLKVEDTLLGRPMRINTDLVVLMAGMVPSASANSIKDITGLETGDNGFFNTLDSNYDVESTNIPGIFVAGNIK